MAMAALSVLVLDQVSKALLVRRSAALPLSSTDGTALVSLRLVTNTRWWVVGRHPGTAVALWLAAVVGTTLSVVVGLHMTNRLALVGFGAALGGATGNLLDGLRHRAVIDFVSVGRWPAFNLADVGIVAGLVVAFSRMGG